MRRAETFWQLLVLSLLLLMTIGIYATLGYLWRQWQAEQQTMLPAMPLPSNGIVQIVEPLEGAVFQRGAQVPVRAALLKAGYGRAELVVDGVPLAALGNPDPQAASWLVEWTWAAAEEGDRRLSVRGRKASGRVEESAPVTVTVVPGGWLAFASNREGAYALYAMPSDGREPVRLTTGPADARQPAVRRDGVIAFVVKNEAAPDAIRQLGGGSEGAADLIAGREPAWSPDGGRLAFSASPEGVSQVFVASTSGIALSQLTAETVYAGQPAWSPDGKRLVYVARREGNWDLWLMGAGGGAPQRLTTDPAQDLEPAWSPDGSRIAFVSNRGGSFQVYILTVAEAVAGQEPPLRRLTDLPRGAESPAWSPDGFWLAFVAYGQEGKGVNSREIYLVRADGRYPVRLTRNAFDDAEPVWVQDPPAGWSGR